MRLIATLAALLVWVASGMTPALGQGSAQPDRTFIQPHEFDMVDRWTPTQGWSPRTVALACPKVVSGPRDWGPLRFFPGPSETWKTQQAIRDACLSEAPDIEAALNRVITEVAGLGLEGPLNWIPVSEPRDFGQGPKRYILIKPNDEKIAGSSSCRSGRSAEMAARSYVRVNVVGAAEKNSSPALLSYLMGHELAHILQFDRITDDLFALEPNYCGWRADLARRLKTQRVLLKYVPFDDGWASEGLADFIGFTIMERLHGNSMPTQSFPPWKSYYGLKNYDLGLFGPGWHRKVTPGYRVSSFWRHLHLRYGLAITDIFEAFYPPRSGDRTPLVRSDAARALEEGLKDMIDRAAPRVLATFFTDFASWVDDPRRVNPAITRAQWESIAFGGCRRIVLSPQDPQTTMTLERIIPYGARCLTVDVAPHPDAGTGDTHYVLSMETGHQKLHVADGLHLGRASVRTGGGAGLLAGLAGRVTYTCSKRLRAGVSVYRDCLANRAGIYVSTPLKPQIEPFVVRWKLAPVEAQPNGNTDTLIVTYAPVDASDGITDEFRRVEERREWVSLTLHVGVDYLHKRGGADGDNEGDTGKPKPDDIPGQQEGPDGAERRAEFVRITPVSSQGSAATVGTALFADDPRADVMSSLNHGIWRLLMVPRMKGEHLRSQTLEGYRKVMQEVEATRWQFFSLLTKEGSIEAMDRERAKASYVAGFVTGILDGGFTDGVLTGQAKTVESYQWMFDQVMMGAPEIRWDDLTTGRTFEADINRENRELMRNQTLAKNPRATKPDPAFAFGAWGEGAVTVVKRDIERLHLRFQGRICEPKASVFVREAGKVETRCGEWRTLAIEGVLSFADSLDGPHIRTVETSAIQDIYDREMRRHPRLGFAPKDDVDDAAGGGGVGTGATPGGAVADQPSCGCDRLKTLADALDGGMPDAAQLSDLDRCCPAFLDCPASDDAATGHVLDICAM